MCPLCLPADNADDEIITSTKPFIKQLYKETAGTHDYSDICKRQQQIKLGQQLNPMCAASCWAGFWSYVLPALQC